MIEFSSHCIETGVYVPQAFPVCQLSKSHAIILVEATETPYAFIKANADQKYVAKMTVRLTEIKYPFKEKTVYYYLSNVIAQYYSLSNVIAQYKSNKYR